MITPETTTGAATMVVCFVSAVVLMMSLWFTARWTA
jgi:hypothetical protein